MKELVVKYTLRELCDLIGAEVPESCVEFQDKKLSKIANRPNFAVENCALFVAANTAEEAEAWIAKAREEGVKVVFIGREFAGVPGVSDIPHIIRAFIPEDVVRVAADIRKRKELTVVGITGSLGKTTTKDFVFEVLNQKFNTSKSMGNQNTIYPILNNLQRIRCDYFVQEFGAGTPGVLPRTVRACIPDVGIITNISEPHLDVFGSKENILKDKVQMITQMPDGCPAFLNYDDEMLRSLTFENRPVISFAAENKEADYYAENILLEDGGVTFDIVHGDKRLAARINVNGRYNVANALAAAAVGEWFGLSDEEILAGLAAFESIGSRQNLVNYGGYRLFIDCYNSSPVSLPGAVEVIENLKIENDGRRIAVLGDMAGRTPEVHRETGQKLGASELDLAFCYGNENARIFADELNAAGIEAYYTDERNVLNEWIRKNVTKNDVVLFKGPTTRFLVRTIDQVFGTSMQIRGEVFEFVNKDDFRGKVISEKELPDKKTAAVTQYNGNDKTVIIPDDLKGIPVFAVGPICFKDNEVIESVKFPETVTNIARGAFRGCSKLKSIKLPPNLLMIEYRAFRECTSLKEVIIPPGVIDIGGEAFYGCTSLKTVYIPESVGQIGEKAFENCENVELVYYKKSYRFKRFMRMDNKTKLKYIQNRLRKIVKH